MAALSADELLVTSKHALGEQEGTNVSHAQKGEEWLEKCLKSVGRSRKDFAALLWENSWTAVAEVRSLCGLFRLYLIRFAQLCDDSFEEHVLAYSAEQTGLHLHGINHNSRHLRTLPPGQVARLAKEWGFITTDFLTLPTIEAVHDFADDCAKEGKWQGQHVEGFVVRSPATSQTEEDTFMFKIKFDQPYLRWRQWRELTRRMLSHRAKSDKAAPAPAADEDADTVDGVNLARINDLETKAYVSWVAQSLEDTPEAFNDWKEGKGIVSARERFFRWQAEHPDWQASLANGVGLKAKGETKAFDRTLLVTIAVPGCGEQI